MHLDDLLGDRKTLGKGSTFQMELPTRADFRKRAL
jgi:hypothetical protein